MGGGDQCWVGAGGDQLSDELLGIGGTDDRLTDEYDVSAAAGEAHDVMGSSHSPSCDACDLGGKNVSDLVEQAAVNDQGVGVAGVNGNDASARIDRGQRLTTGTGLDDGAHPQGVDPLDESFQNQGLKTGVEHEQIGTVCPGLMHLVRGHHEIVGKDREIHCRPDGIQILQ